MSTAAPVKESRRPADTAFKQQRLKAWQPILTPAWVISTFTVVGAIFIPIGVVILSASNDIQETIVPYSTNCPDPTDDNKAWTPRVCTQTFKLDEIVKGPVYVYYQLSNFYQNHRRYVKSRSDRQFRGDFGPSSLTPPATDSDDWNEKPLQDCEPETSQTMDVTIDGQTSSLFYYPCGLIARSLFNDTFTLTLPNGETYSPGATEFWSKDNIAWPSDRSEKFISKDKAWLDQYCANTVNTSFPSFGAPFTNPSGLTSAEAAAYYTLEAGKLSSNRRYYCWHNVSDPDFVVWMRTAGLPVFKKLYRVIPNDLPQGTYTVTINNNYPVAAFGGGKSLILSTTSWIGGKNVFLGTTYVVVGALCVLLAAIFLAKHLISPRVLGDQKYLVWKH